MAQGESTKNTTIESQINPLAMRIGAILTFKDSGTKRLCGQTLGADGAGYYCVMFLGDPEQAETAAREFIDKISAYEFGRISEVHLIPALETYSGVPISVVDLDVCR